MRDVVFEERFPRKLRDRDRVQLLADRLGDEFEADLVAHLVGSNRDLLGLQQLPPPAERHRKARLAEPGDLEDDVDTDLVVHEGEIVVAHLGDSRVFEPLGARRRHRVDRGLEVLEQLPRLLIELGATPRAIADRPRIDTVGQQDDTTEIGIGILFFQFAKRPGQVAGRALGLAIDQSGAGGLREGLVEAVDLELVFVAAPFEGRSELVECRRDAVVSGRLAVTGLQRHRPTGVDQHRHVVFDLFDVLQVDGRLQQQQHGEPVDGRPKRDERPATHRRERAEIVGTDEDDGDPEEGQQSQPRRRPVAQPE